MRIRITLPSGEPLAVELETVELEALKRHIESLTGLLPAYQELYSGGRIIDQLAANHTDLDLVLRIGPSYAIAADGVETPEDIETFRPSASIIAARDFAHFRHHSNNVRIHDNRPLEKTADISEAKERAQQRVDPYRKLAKPRRKRLDSVCRELGPGAIVAMTFNAPYAILFRNWHASCLANGFDVRQQTLVFPLDDDAEQAAHDLGYATFTDAESYGAYERREGVRFGDRQWIDCLFMKNAVMLDLLQVGAEVLFQDADVVWNRNPIPYLARKAARESWDFLFQKAAYNPIFQPLYYNSGFVYGRSNEFSRLSWERIVDLHHFCYAQRSQQSAVNVVMNTFRERGLRTAALDPDLFINGHRIKPGSTDQPLDRYPHAYMLHLNWTESLQAKLERLREAGLWFLDDQGALPASGRWQNPVIRTTERR